MPRIVFIAHDGQRFERDAQLGATVMETAVQGSVPGIDADCGGACSCATCHVHVDPAWMKAVGQPGPVEEDMLDLVMGGSETSRLSCQITVTQDLDGLVVRMPESQV